MQYLSVKNYEKHQLESKTRKGGAVSTDDIPAEIMKTAVASGDDLEPTSFPCLSNLSAAFIFNFVPRPTEVRSPEFVYVPIGSSRRYNDDLAIRTELTLTYWNMAWEAAHLRMNFIHELEPLPKELMWLEQHQEENIYLLPAGRPCSKYHAYSPLYHLLPPHLLESYGLPLLKKGMWPYLTDQPWKERLLPSDFVERLSRAFARYIWPLLNPGSKLSAFSKQEPLHLLAHNLDFWMPYAIQVVEARMRQFPRVRIDDDDQRAKLKKVRKSLPVEIKVDRPFTGGEIWQGTAEAWEAANELVSRADAAGRLRAIMDAIRSNRVEEDFSDCWSYAREDFERKLYHKRMKIKIRFVELDDTIPVLGPESEIHDRILWDQFLAILSEKERTIVVLLRSGVTKLNDVARHLGYANHSPVTKALAKLAKKAKDFINS
jgi:hypothetical protein